MSDEDDPRPSYDPTNPAPPSREPPLRSTAPQSDYTIIQVAIGMSIALSGLLLTVGVGLALA